MSRLTCDGECLLAKKDFEDARYCLERARSRLSGNDTPLAHLLRLLTRTMLQYSHDAIRAIDTIPALVAADCGGDVASHEPALDGKGIDADTLDSLDALDRELSRSWEMPPVLTEDEGAALETSLHGLGDC